MNTTSSNTTFFTVNTPSVETRNDGSVCIPLEEFEDLLSSKQELSSYKKENKELRDELQNLKTLIEITMRAEEFKEELLHEL